MPKVAVAAAVVVIDMVKKIALRKCLFAALLLISSSALFAAVLPEDRSDVMFHSYGGGGVTIDGPSLLIRKDIASTVSVSANYYVDKVSSASIDVETSGASEYTEERTEYSFGADYLYSKSIISAGYTSSKENDYQANTLFLGVAQDFFGDLTTISIGYARGNDTVRQNGNDDFEDKVDRQNYRIGLSQILTPSLIMSINYEAITDEGFLNNPYRSYRYIDPNNPDNYLSETEVYPRTRTSDAAAIGGRYFLPYRAVIHAKYRYFTDDWDIKANTFELGYTHPIGGWIFDLSYRQYSQTNAYFYSDLHDFRAIDQADFRARDKELSQFSTQTLGFGVSYEFQMGNSNIFDKSSINFQYDMIKFDYDNFRDLRDTSTIGEEKLYSFSADVFRIYFSIWY